MYATITLDELTAKAERGGPIVAEILPPSYYEAGHLPGAVNLPLDGFEANAARVLGDPGAEIVVYCSGPTCNNSKLAARKLEALGYANVRVFEGGKAAWRDAGLTLTVSR